MEREPVACELGHAIERPRLLEQVRRIGDDLEPPLAPEQFERPAIELEDLLVRAADDQQGAEARGAKLGRDLAVPRAVPAAAAPVREHDDRTGLAEDEIALDRGVADLDLHRLDTRKATASRWHQTVAFGEEPNP